MTRKQTDTFAKVHPSTGDGSRKLGPSSALYRRRAVQNVGSLLPLAVLELCKLGDTGTLSTR